MQSRRRSRIVSVSLWRDFRKKKNMNLPPSSPPIGTYLIEFKDKRSGVQTRKSSNRKRNIRFVGEINQTRNNVEVRRSRTPLRLKLQPQRRLKLQPQRRLKLQPLRPLHLQPLRPPHLQPLRRLKLRPRQRPRVLRHHLQIPLQSL